VPSAPLPASATPLPSPALSAFLRGIERRAFVFAQVQCGQDGAAQAALGRAMRAFRNDSAITPLSAWPAAFWTRLLAQEELSGGQSDIPELTALSSGPRAALLLRMVGGLDFAHAASVMGVSEPTYRFALQRALQQLGDAGISYAVLGALRERLHRQVKTLPDDRIDALAELRAGVLAGAPAPSATPSRQPPRRRWLLPLLWLCLVLLALAFIATYLPVTRSLAPGAVEGLPAESVAPSLPTDDESELVTHPDFAQLAAPDDEALARELALLSWIASGEAEIPTPAEPPVQASGEANAP
jgi:hypothetical protein